MYAAITLTAITTHIAAAVAGAFLLPPLWRKLRGRIADWASGLR